MAVKYKLINADIFEIQPNLPNKKFAFLAKASDGKIYHIKPSWQGHFNNINEYIAHHIGSLIGAPILHGSFIKINKKNMERWRDIVNSFHPNLMFPTFLPPCDDAVFFGVEYRRYASPASSVRELSFILKKANNKEGFFSQYAYDQYLRNPDRHLGNHLLLKDSHTILFYLIDFDRIFNGITDWSSVKTDYPHFDCYNIPGYNADLYQLVDNHSIKSVHNYAAKISNINDADINDICDTIVSAFNIKKDDLAIISQWLQYRREKIYDKCLENETCFTKVTQKGLGSANR